MPAPAEAPKTQTAPPTGEAKPAAPAVGSLQVDRPALLVTERPAIPQQSQPPIGETLPLLTQAEPSAANASVSNEPAPTTASAETSSAASEPAAPVESAAASTVSVVETPSVQTPETQVTFESPSEPAPKDTHGSHDGHDHGESHHEEATPKPTPLDTILKTTPEKKDMCGSCQGTCPGCSISKLGDVSRVKITIDLSNPVEEDADSRIQALHEAAQTVTPGKYQTITTSEGDFFGKISEDGKLEGVWKVKTTKVTPVDQPIPVAETHTQPASFAPEQIVPSATAPETVPTTPTTEQPTEIITVSAPVEIAPSTLAPEPTLISSAPSVATFEPTEPSIAATSAAPTEMITKAIAAPEPATAPASEEPVKPVAQTPVTELADRFVSGTLPKITEITNGFVTPTEQKEATSPQTSASHQPEGQPPRRDNKAERRKRRELGFTLAHKAPTEETPIITVRRQERNNRRRVESGKDTETPHAKQDDQHHNTRRESSHAKLKTKDRLRTIIHGRIPQQQKTESSHTSDFSNGNKDATAAKVREAVPANVAELDKQARMEALQVLQDMTPAITSPEQPEKKKTTEHRAEKNKKRKISFTKGEVFASTITGELQKTEKRKKRKRKIENKRSAEKISFKQRKTEKAGKPTEKTIRRKRQVTRETVMQPIHERRIHQILSQERRAAIQARLRERAKTKPNSEILTREKQKPLVLILPEKTPVEQIAGAIIRIAKEKRTKEKSPQVQIVVSEKTYRALKKLFTEAIESKPTKQTNSIEIICGKKKMTLDVEKIKLLEHLFTDFEAQFLLLQLRQCLVQSEIREATVLCSCQQQDSATSFEKISFCQGCHQGYLQQAFFWLITILWYTIYEMTLDQKQNQLYTQSYSYEQRILTS